MKVKRAMHKGIMCVEPDMPIRDVAKQMQKDNVGAIPVWKNGKLFGIITDRDIVCRAVASGRALSDLTASEVMTPKVISCDVNDDIEKAISMMKKKHVWRLPVVDSANTLLGMVSLGDIARIATVETLGKILVAVSDHHV